MPGVYPIKQLAVDKALILFKGCWVLGNIYPKKQKIFGIKVYNLCYCLRCTYNLRAYIAEQCEDVTADVTSTHGTG
jgi:hypothetical protein